MVVELVVVVVELVVVVVELGVVLVEPGVVVVVPQPPEPWNPPRLLPPEPPDPEREPPPLCRPDDPDGRVLDVVAGGRVVELPTALRLGLGPDTDTGFAVDVGGLVPGVDDRVG